MNEYIYMDLLVCLTGCGPTSPTMLSNNRIFKNPVVVQLMWLDVLLVFSICQNFEQVGSNTSEAMELPVRSRVTGKESKFPSSISFTQAANRGCGPD